jgi:signal peptidase I
MKVPQKIWVPFTAISIPTFLPDYRFPAFKDVERGDVVVFEYPRDNVYKYVKRCIGLPGDTVRINNRNVFVNDKEYLLPDGGQFLSENPASETYIDENIFMNLGNKDNLKKLIIPKRGDIYKINQEMNWELIIPILLFEGNKVELVFNDQKLTFTNEDPYDLYRRTGNRAVFDNFVPQPNASLINPWMSLMKKEYLKYLKINGLSIDDIDTYTLKQNYYWMMGDNRDNSEDSRFWGFVPESHILGQPVITWFSIDLESYLPRLSRIGNVPN